MMRFITGTPGAGKTLFAVSEILLLAKENREIYTNIAGITVPGVTFVDAGDDFDWRNYPDGSLFVYDEAHQIFRATGKPGLSNDPIISEMDMHRHRGFDLWFITQFPTKVHHEIRSMCDEHYHLLRQFGASQATLYKWPEAVDVKDTAQRQVADKSIFRYPKECFKYYKSASEHTAKLRIPAKLKMFSVVIALVILIVGYRVSSTGGFSSFNTESSIPEIATAGATEAQPWPASGGFSLASDTPVRDEYALGGCVASARGCQCYTPALKPIPMQDDECRNTIEKPLPTNLNFGGKKSNHSIKTVDSPA